jgi:hypothetical protein
MRGAAAAARAAQCWLSADRPDRAARSWELLLDLDPAAQIEGEADETSVPASQGLR